MLKLQTGTVIDAKRNGVYRRGKHAPRSILCEAESLTAYEEVLNLKLDNKYLYVTRS